MVYVPLAPIRPAHTVDKLRLQMPDQMGPIATYQLLGAEPHRLSFQSLVKTASNRKPDPVLRVLFHPLPMARISLCLDVFSLGIRFHELAI